MTWRQRWRNRKRRLRQELVPPNRILPPAVPEPYARWDSDINFIRNEDVLLICVPVGREKLARADALRDVVGEVEDTFRRLSTAAVRTRMRDQQLVQPL